MSGFTSLLTVSPLADGHTWMLRESFGYSVGSLQTGDTITVPVGFCTDFATVPRIFWAILPRWGRYGNAAVVHDFLYWTQERSRAEADRIFLEGMTVLEVKRLVRWAMFKAVRWFGWMAWYCNARDRAMGTDRVRHLPAINEDLKPPRRLGPVAHWMRAVRGS